MKVEIINKNKEDFKPIELKITIKSQEEYHALKVMSCRDISIPELCGEKHKQHIFNLLKEINKKLGRVKKIN